MLYICPKRTTILRFIWHILLLVALLTPFTAAADNGAASATVCAEVQAADDDLHEGQTDSALWMPEANADACARSLSKIRVRTANHHTGVCSRHTALCPTASSRRPAAQWGRRNIGLPGRVECDFLCTYRC